MQHFLKVQHKETTVSSFQSLAVKFGRFFNSNFVLFHLFHDFLTFG